MKHVAPARTTEVVQSGGRTTYHVTDQGYIALMSAVVISLILIGLTATVSTTGYFARFNTLNGEYKRVSLGLADSCVNVALLKMAQDYNYTTVSDPDYDAGLGGVVVDVGPDDCLIKNPASASDYSLDPAHHQKIAHVITQAQYSGAFSNLDVAATVQDPTTVPVPRANLTVVTQVVNNNGGTKSSGDFTMHVTGTNPSTTTFPGAATGVVVLLDAGAYSVTEDVMTGYTQTDCSGIVSAGDNVTCTIINDDIPTTASLTVVANVINDNGGTKLPSDFPLTIDGTAQPSGSPLSGLTPGPHTAAGATIAGYTMSAWGYDCDNAGQVTLNAGDSKTCKATFDDIPPPSPSCADTVMTLDRSGSMFGNPQWIPDEQAAAKTLLNLYSTVTPHPLVGVGRFGDSTGQLADIVGTLTNDYGFDQSSGSQTFVMQNAGIPATASNISVTLHAIAKEVNGTTASMALLTQNGASQVQDAGHALTNAYVDYTWTMATNPLGGNWTSSEVNNWTTKFGVIRTNSGASLPRVTQIHVTLSYSNNVGLTLAAPTGAGNYTQWTANTGSTWSAVASNDGNSSYVSTSLNNMRQSFIVPNAVIPPGATITSVDFNVIALGSGSPASFQLMLENSAFAPADRRTDAIHNPTAAYASYQYNNAPMTTNPFTGLAWTVSEVTNWAIRFGVQRPTTTGTPRVTQISVIVNYALSGQTATVNPVSVGDLDQWTANTGTKIAAVTSNDSDTTYIDTSSTGLYGHINNDLTNNSSSTNLSAAISVSDTELNSTRHILGHKKVLVLISDGLPTRPSGNASSAAIASANAAKSGTGPGKASDNIPTQIYTIHFGDSSGQAFLASLASPDAALANIVSGNGAVRSGGTVTITTTTPHGLGVGQTIKISGVDNGALNGSFVITTVPSLTVFTYSQSGSNITSGGGSVAFPHSFISPNSSDMTNVFTTIGKIVCPAAAAPPPGPPTHATLVVLTHVINDNGGTSQASDFTMNISAVNPSIASFPGSESPGVNVTVDPGAYSANEGAIGSYSKTLGADCAGSITAGQTKTCTITNDDLPPPPPPPPPLPPPPPNITVGAWEEKP